MIQPHGQKARLYECTNFTHSNTAEYGAKKSATRRKKQQQQPAGTRETKPVNRIHISSPIVRGPGFHGGGGGGRSFLPPRAQSTKRLSKPTIVFLPLPHLYQQQSRRETDTLLSAFPRRELAPVVYRKEKRSPPDPLSNTTQSRRTQPPTLTTKTKTKPPINHTLIVEFFLSVGLSQKR